MDRSVTQRPLCEEGSERLWLRGLPGLEHPQGERAAVAEPPHGLHKAAAAPLSATPLPFPKHQLASVKYLANPCSEDSCKVPLWRQWPAQGRLQPLRTSPCSSAWRGAVLPRLHLGIAEGKPPSSPSSSCFQLGAGQIVLLIPWAAFFPHD